MKMNLQMEVIIFFVNEGIQSAVNIGDMYYPDYTEEQLARFTESLMTFPLY
jgi:hypothetical protein